jgi:hypothetical protein
LQRPSSLKPSAWSLLFLGLSSCGSCSKDAASGDASASPSASPARAEVLPRCRADGKQLALSGADLVVGDAAIGPGGLLVGVVRSEGGKRVGVVVRASLDLATSTVIDVGPAFGDDPPPSPRYAGERPYVAFLSRQTTDGGSRVRMLSVAPLGDGALGPVEATVLQQADESTAFDVAWTGDGAALAAWDEDAPSRLDGGIPGVPDRGLVKVQTLSVAGSPVAPPKDNPPRRVASPDTSDAESPRLVARPGGFWLAWLARRAEDDGHTVEAPGEKRAFRWVEAVALDARGEPAGPVRRVSPTSGRAAAFDLSTRGADLVVIVQDEAAASEGGGSRIVRYVVSNEVESADLVDGGVGETAELVPSSAQGEAARWLAWSDGAERMRLMPLGPELSATGRMSSEPALDGARVLASSPPDVVYALVGAGPRSEGSGEAVSQPRLELRRFTCK